MYIYHVKPGKIFQGNSPTLRSLVSSDCYSGRGDGKNNSAYQHVDGVGPIPCGAYFIGEVTDHKGPMTITLVPLQGTTMFGRSAIRIHGDSIEHPGEASHGCIIAPPFVRKRIIDGSDRLLVVLSGEE